MDYRPFASNEDSDSREVPGEGEPPSESTEEETITPPRVSAVLSVADPDADIDNRDQQPPLQLGVIRWPGARYNLTLWPGKHHLGQRTS